MDPVEKKIDRVCTLMDNIELLLGQVILQKDMLEETMEEISEEFPTGIDILSHDYRFNHRYESLLKKLAHVKWIEEIIDLDNYMEG